MIYQKRPITFELICGFAEMHLAIWMDWHCLSRHHLQTVSAWVVITLSPCMRAMQLSSMKAKWKFLLQGATSTVWVSVHGMVVAAWILLPANFPGDVLSRQPMESDEITFWTTSRYGLYLICKKWISCGLWLSRLSKIYLKMQKKWIWAGSPTRPNRSVS